MKNYLLIAVGAVAFFSCKEELSEEDEFNKVGEEIQEQHVDPDSLIIEVEGSGPRYTKGRYYLPLEEGYITMLIHEKSVSECKFVFDTGPGTPTWAKLAGDLTVDKNGVAKFSNSSCEELKFDFSESGIHVTETKCRYHSRSISFEGLYTDEVPEQPMSADEMLKAIQGGDLKFDFYASFTEPFWTVYIVKNKVLLYGSESPAELHKLVKPFDPNKEAQTLYYDRVGGSTSLHITKEPGSDGMSDISYPYNVVWQKTYWGGGATKLQSVH